MTLYVDDIDKIKAIAKDAAAEAVAGISDSSKEIEVLKKTIKSLESSVKKLEAELKKVQAKPTETKKDDKKS